MTLVERYAAALREAVIRLADELAVGAEDFSALWGPRADGLGFSLPADQRRLAERGARCLLGEWLVGYAAGQIPATASVADAHRWWINELPLAGRISVPAIYIGWHESERPDPALAMALLPYLLDPIAPATRRDILSGSLVHGERRQRKAGGIYFTPGDVASFMVSGLAGGREPGTWLDPAAGTGAFLRSVLKLYPASRVFGIDIDPLAAELAAFTLTATVRNGPSFWASWQLHRLNLVTGDALTIRRLDNVACDSRTRLSDLMKTRQDLSAGDVGTSAPITGGLGQASLWSLGDALPELLTGPEAVVQNPPYAAPLLERTALLAQRWGMPLPQNIFTLFLEQGVGLIPAAGRMAAVVPASIVTSSVASIRRCRGSLGAAGGELEVLSYDRAPDGLFGDDVKTRCSVLFLDKTRPAGIRIGPLRRITSSNRRSALVRGETVRVPAAEFQAALPPKLGSAAEWQQLQALRRTKSSLSDLITSVSSRPPAGDGRDHLHVLLAPTAYNWLNVIRRSADARAAGHDSLHPFLELRFADDIAADAGYAILSSRLALWLWRVFGDGFHVGQWLPRLVPAPPPGNADELQPFAKLGNEIWAAVSRQPLLSQNRGRTTVAFPPNSASRLLIDEVDQRLLGFIGLSDPPFGLREWARSLAAVGRRRERTGASPW